MSRGLKILLGIALATGLFIIGAGWVMSGAPMPTIPPAKTPAPAGFDAALYPELSTIKATDRAEVLNLGDYGQPLEHYFIPDLSVTYFLLATNTELTRILFVNREGKLIGDIVDQPQIFQMGSFMVTPDAYYEVAARGVSDRQPMEVLPSLDKADIERMIGESTHYRSFSPTDLPTNDPDRIAGRSVHVMRHHGEWKRIASAELEYRDWKGAPFHELEAVYKISRPPGSGQVANFFGGRYRVELTHFDQHQFLPRRGAPMGSPTGQGRPAQWIGTGYYTVFINDAPALHFRIENDREFLYDSGPVQLIAEGGAGVDFISITHTDRAGMRDTIVVSAR